MVRIEADQRLVEQQQPRAAEQRLGQQQPLPLAARQLRQRPARQLAGADQIQHAIDFGSAGLVRKGQAQAMAVDDAWRRSPSR